jgi:FKBP-type peptidyl-prolyl cis-trans isomerase
MSRIIKLNTIEKKKIIGGLLGFSFSSLIFKNDTRKTNINRIFALKYHPQKQQQQQQQQQHEQQQQQQQQQTATANSNSKQQQQTAAKQQNNKHLPVHVGPSSV